MRIRELPLSEQPDVRLRDAGPAALSDTELLAVLIRVGVSGTDVVQLAQELLVRYGGWSGLLRAGHCLEQFYRLTLSLGLRQGEVLGLRWEDVDFAKRTIRISGAIQQIGGTIQRVTPKTEASARTLPLTPLLLRSLKAHQAAQQLEKQECWAEWQEHDLVFPSEVGTPLAPRNLQRHFKGLLKKAGLPGRLRFHDLRHSCATFLIAQGVHSRVVMELLGHSQISVTMNTYAHVLPDTQRDAAAKLDALLGGSGTSSKEQSKARAGEGSEAGEADKQGGLNEQSDEESKEESDEDQRP